MEQNILNLLLNQGGPSDVKKIHKNDAEGPKYCYPLKNAKKPSAKKLRSKNKDRPQQLSQDHILNVITDSACSEVKCKELLELMKSGGTQFQQLNEQALTQLITHFLKLASDDSESIVIKSILDNGDKKVQKMANQQLGETSMDDRAMAVFLGLYGVFTHHITKEILINLFNQQLMAVFKKDKAGLQSAYQIMFQTLLLAIGIPNKDSQKPTAYILLPWFDAISDLYFVHYQFIRGRSAKTNQSDSIVDLIDLIQQKLQMEVQLIKEQTEIVGQLEFLQQNAEVLASQLHVGLTEDKGTGDLLGSYEKETLIV